jgi:pseudouridine-5'-phosphate glycosidase
VKHGVAAVKESFLRDFQWKAEVKMALDAGNPVVALESTIIAHGFPRPDNLDVGLALETAVREAGAVPATIALIGGEVHIGLEEAQIERLALSGDVAKCSLRDLGYVSAQGRNGATTVAATVRLAAMAGIRVFATGGIGGVHPGAGSSFDISADLQELGRAPVAVVCAGAKSILDLPATLEVLETAGVPVIGFRCDEFPAFHCRSSGLPLPCRTDSPQELALIAKRHWELGLESAVLVCNPPPQDVAFAPDELADLVARAQRQAQLAGIGGGALTPYLLEALNQLSGGRTRVVNRALALSNATVGAQLAVALAEE